MKNENLKRWKNADLDDYDRPKRRNRVRFNSGYHDAQTHAYTPVRLRTWEGEGVRDEEWARCHFCYHYGQGFLAGIKDKAAGAYTGNSTAAWDQFQSNH